MAVRGVQRILARETKACPSTDPLCGSEPLPPPPLWACFPICTGTEMAKLSLPLVPSIFRTHGNVTGWGAPGLLEQSPVPGPP